MNPHPSAPMADRDSAPWWAAIAEHRLTLQRCAGCDVPRVIPRALCQHCGSFDRTWADALGTGTVASWTVVHRAVDGRPTPYVVLLVRLDDAAHLVLPGGWSGASDGSDLQVGLPVEVGFTDLPAAADGARTALLTWSAAASRASAWRSSVDT